MTNLQLSIAILFFSCAATDLSAFRLTASNLELAIVTEMREYDWADAEDSPVPQRAENYYRSTLDTSLPVELRILSLLRGIRAEQKLEATQNVRQICVLAIAFRVSEPFGAEIHCVAANELLKSIDHHQFDIEWLEDTLSALCSDALSNDTLPADIRVKLLTTWALCLDRIVQVSLATDKVLPNESELSDRGVPAQLCEKIILSRKQIELCERALTILAQSDTNDNEHLSAISAIQSVEEFVMTSERTVQNYERRRDEVACPEVDQIVIHSWNELITGKSDP